MSYSVSISWQVSNFFMSMGLGFFIGFGYDFILNFTTAFSKAKCVYIVADLVFSVISTLMFFCYTLIYCQGETRLISIIACLLGAIVFHFTVGKLISKLLNKLAAIIKKTLIIIFYPLIIVVKYIFKKSKKFINKLEEKLKNTKKHEQIKSKTKKEGKSLGNLNKKVLNFKKRLEKKQK